MKSPSQLTLASFAHTLLLELGEEVEADVQRDLVTLDRRLNCEGETFLTLTMPLLADWLLLCLEEERVVASPSSFATKRYGLVRLPAFLSGFSMRIFNLDGSLSPCAHREIRNFLQFTRCFAKIERPTSRKREDAAFEQYIETDKEVTDERIRSATFGSNLQSTAIRLFRDSLGYVDRTLCSTDATPNHGPGSTADGLLGNAKYQFDTWYSRMEPLFPLDQYAIPNHRYWRHLSKVRVLDPGSEIPVKVISVPKTAKGPRIIAMEPTHVQFVQQGVKNLVYAAISKDRVSRLVGFTDQSRNQSHAKVGSEDRSIATLDLSEASDRVSNELVKHIFAPWHTLSEALQRSRSTSADVRGTVVPLKKFASMGSALCFPVEAIVFLTICVNAIEDALSIRYDPNNCNWDRYVSVYGDDIVVPRELAYFVIDRLERYGLKVNEKKSFIKGHFRESCGRDYWKGHDVTSVRVRQDVPCSKQDAESVASWVSLRNQLYKVGLWKTTKWLDIHLQRVLGDYPIVREWSEYLGRHSFLEDPNYGIFDTMLHYRKLRAWKLHSKIPSSPLTGVPALMKTLTVKSEDPNHLEHAGRPHAVKLKRGWTRY